MIGRNLLIKCWNVGLDLHSSILSYNNKARTFESEPGFRMPFTIDIGIDCKSGMMRKAVNTPDHRYFNGIKD
jgi:hypothetical protein